MSVINNALTGAVAAQMAMNTTSQNVANEMTTGYTRQGVVLGSIQPLQGGINSPGDGVQVQSIQRISDQYQVAQMWASNSSLGQPTASQPYFTQLEQIMGDDTDGIPGGLDNFFSALNAASVDPTSSPLRQQVIASANSLAARSNSLTQVLQTQRTDVQQQRGSMVQQINSLTAGVATLNTQIKDAQASGTNTSGLQDARDQDVDQLSSLVGVQVTNQPDGTISVSLNGGQALVIGNIAGTMSVAANASGGQTVSVQFAQDSFAVNDSVVGGQLGGLGSYEQGTIVPMLTALSSLAQQLTTSVNTTLAAGYDLNGNPGAALFQFTASGITGNLSVNQSLTPDQLAFSNSATVPGDSTNLQALIGIQSSTVTVPPVGTVQLNDVMTQLVGLLGTQSQQNQNSMQTAQTVRTQAQSNWSSTSGVNNDEEAANLVQYQQMYQANMKVIGVADTLFQSVLAIFPSG